MKLKKVNDDKANIRLDIVPQPSGEFGTLADNGYSPGMFEPQAEERDRTSSGSSTRDPLVPAPEKKLTLFALRLAILEKAASGLGTLAFIWATVVLLGGFASSLKTKDFWLVTMILVIEGARIFSRSHELEWQHQATSWSLAAAGRNSFHSIISSSRFVIRAIKSIFNPASASQDSNQRDHPKTKQQRTWQPTEVPLLPYIGWLFVSKNISTMLYWQQILSAAACAGISLMRLVQQDYGQIDNGDNALNIYYGLGLADASVFLIEKLYWSWKIRYTKLLDQVCNECELGPAGMVSIRRFFYDSFSKCIEGSIFDGLKMDLVSFAEELLASNSRDEQLIGARILHKFTESYRYSEYALRKIGTSTEVIERLIEMLNWKNTAEEEIRMCAAEIASKLAGKKYNAVRVAEVPGAIESVTSLLYTGRTYNMIPHEIGQKQVVADSYDYEYSAFSLLGLSILKKLARDQDNCAKIGSTKGLVPKIIDLTSAGQNLLRNDRAPESQITTVKRSLQLVKLLVRTTGQTGEMLRKKVSEVVFTISNIREILQYGESHIVLQKLGIEILTNLAIDSEAGEKIGGTGGVIRLLLSILLQQRLTEDQNYVSAEAGEALAVLALESGDNCERILKAGNMVPRMMELLADDVLGMHVSRILMNLCTYSQPECLVHLRDVTAAAPTVLKSIMVKKEKYLVASLGLLTQILRFLAAEEFPLQLAKVSIKDEDFAAKLTDILKKYSYPEINVPRIRRFVIKVAIWMMKSDEQYIRLFKNLGAEDLLKNVAETTSELECFTVFSGSVGMFRDKVTIFSLVDRALELLA